MKFLKASAVIASLLALGSVAYGDSLKMTTSAYSNGSNGGSYTVTIQSGPANNSSYSPLATLSATSFESFCLEPTETFSNNGVYNYTIADSAINGANEDVSRNVGAGDRLSLGTTWLYSQFATGVLTGYNYSLVGTARQASNLLLQRAVWFLEDDYASYTTAAALANPFLNQVAILFGGSANAAGLDAARANAASGANGVWALNLTSGTNNQTQNQSQLYYSVPDNGTTLVLLGIALLGLVGFQRKFAAAK